MTIMNLLLQHDKYKQSACNTAVDFKGKYCTITTGPVGGVMDISSDNMKQQNHKPARGCLQEKDLGEAWTKVALFRVLM